ncbi:MAG: hypothetical protein R2788_00550 [Saprospiraceae bacterium]
MSLLGKEVWKWICRRSADFQRKTIARTNGTTSPSATCSFMPFSNFDKSSSWSLMSLMESVRRYGCIMPKWRAGRLISSLPFSGKNMLFAGGQLFFRFFQRPQVRGQ